MVGDHEHSYKVLRTWFESKGGYSPLVHDKISGKVPVYLQICENVTNKTDGEYA